MQVFEISVRGIGQSATLVWVHSSSDIIEE